MKDTHAEVQLRRFGRGNPDTSRVVSPRFDELLVAAQSDGEAAGTVVFRSRSRERLRVVKLTALGPGRWEVVSEVTVPLTATLRSGPEGPVAYREREFHFVPGSGPAPGWVDVERPPRVEAER